MGQFLYSWTKNEVKRLGLILIACIKTLQLQNNQDTSVLSMDYNEVNKILMISISIILISIYDNWFVHDTML